MGDRTRPTLWAHEMAELRRAARVREFPTLQSGQGVRVTIEGREVIMLSSNNYLGLASHPTLKASAREAIDQFGCGTASVRIICGYTELHRALEERLARFLGVEATLLFTSCSTANEGLLPVLAGEQDVIISDELNHASLIDGCRLSRAKVRVYPHASLEGLEQVLREVRGARRIIIATDGVFSMEGDIAPLPRIVALAERYGAITVVDESHATGVLGRLGRGTVEHFGLERRVDIQTGTLGKALGGALGGYVAGSRPLIDLLIQQCRPILFSNSLPPAVVAGALAAIGVIEEAPTLRTRLLENARWLRTELQAAGFDVPDGETPIIPLIVKETSLATGMSRRLLQEGVFVQGFGYPVVPEGSARLRIQVSALHSPEDLRKVLSAFQRVGIELGLLRGESP